MIDALFNRNGFHKEVRDAKNMIILLYQTGWIQVTMTKTIIFKTSVLTIKELGIQGQNGNHYPSGNPSERPAELLIGNSIL